MSQALGLDLQEQAIAGHLAFDEISEAVLRCRLCLESGGNSLAAFSEHVDLGLIRPRGQV
jgi:hypothetical protein